MVILSASGGVATTNCYLIADEVSGDCVLIDAPDHTVGPLLDEIVKRGWRLAALWLTHAHFDHMADHAEVKARFPNSGLVSHADGVARLANPTPAIFRLPFTIPPAKATALIGEGDVETFGSLSARAMLTPGHCPGHVAYYFEAQRVLVGGDLIIGGAIGRTDFPDCSVQEMQKSLQRVMALPDDTRLLPGHGGETTLGEERRKNPYVRMALAGRLAEV